MDQDGRTRMRANFVQPQLKLQPQLPRPCVANGGRAKRLLEKTLGTCHVRLETCLRGPQGAVSSSSSCGTKTGWAFFRGLASLDAAARPIASITEPLRLENNGPLEVRFTVQVQYPFSTDIEEGGIPPDGSQEILVDFDPGYKASQSSAKKGFSSIEGAS